MSNKFSKQLRANEQKAKVKVNLSSDDAQPDVLDSRFTGERVVELYCHQIEPDPDQPRKIFDPVKLQEFYLDILANGQLQPIIVRQDDNGKLIIKFGERRWRAISLSNGELKVKAIIVKDDNNLFKLRVAQTAENEIRESLDPFELAASYAEIVKLGEEQGLTKQKIADLLHINRTKLLKYLNIYQSPRLKTFIEEIHNKKINDVEVLYNLTLLEKEDPEAFDNKIFIERLNDENRPIRDVIRHFKDTTQAGKKTEKKSNITKTAKTIHNIDLHVVDNANFILKINNKEFTLSQEQVNKIKNILNTI